MFYYIENIWRKPFKALRCCVVRECHSNSMRTGMFGLLRPNRGGSDNRRNMSFDPLCVLLISRMWYFFWRAETDAQIGSFIFLVWTRNYDTYLGEGYGKSDRFPGARVRMTATQLRIWLRGFYLLSGTLLFFELYWIFISHFCHHPTPVITKENDLDISVLTVRLWIAAEKQKKSTFSGGMLFGDIIVRYCAILLLFTA